MLTVQWHSIQPNIRIAGSNAASFEFRGALQRGITVRSGAKAYRTVLCKVEEPSEDSTNVHPPTAAAAAPSAAVEPGHESLHMDRGRSEQGCGCEESAAMHVDAEPTPRPQKRKRPVHLLDALKRQKVDPESPQTPQGTRTGARPPVKDIQSRTPLQGSGTRAPDQDPWTVVPLKPRTASQEDSALPLDGQEHACVSKHVAPPNRSPLAAKNQSAAGSRSDGHHPENRALTLPAESVDPLQGSKHQAAEARGQGSTEAKRGNRASFDGQVANDPVGFVSISEVDAGAEKTRLALLRAEEERRPADSRAAALLTAQALLLIQAKASYQLLSEARAKVESLQATRADAAANVSFLQRKIAGLELERDGQLKFKAYWMQKQVDMLKEAAVVAAEGDEQRRRISGLEQDLSEEKRRRVSELEQDLAEQRRLLQDKLGLKVEAEIAKLQIAGLQREVDGLLVKADARQIQINRLKAAAAAGDTQRKRIYELEGDLAEQRSLLQDKGMEAEVAKQHIAGLQREVGGLLVKAYARQIQIDRLKAAAATADDMQRKRIYELEGDLAEQGSLLQDKGKEAEVAKWQIAGLQREDLAEQWSLLQDKGKEAEVAKRQIAGLQRERISELERDLAEQRSLLRDKRNEAEIAKWRVAGLEHEVNTLLVKADVRQIEKERLQVAAAGGGGNQQDRKIQELELAMEKQRRGLEGKVREAEAECSRLKVRLNKAEDRGESISMADVRADIQRAVAACPDPATKKKMYKDLSLKWHPDKKPVMSFLATEVSKLINVLCRG
eukprot:gene19863-26556_t